MLKLDMNTYLATCDRPEGAIMLYEEDDSHERAIDNAIEQPDTLGSKIGYVLSYALMISFFAYLFITF